MGRTHWWRHRLHSCYGCRSRRRARSICRANARLVSIICCCVVGSFLGLAFFSAILQPLGRNANTAARRQRAAVGFGGFLGSLLCGVLAEHYNIAMPFLYMPVLVAVGIAVQWGLLKFGQAQAATR